MNQIKIKSGVVLPVDSFSEFDAFNSNQFNSMTSIFLTVKLFSLH